jgi:hypothetical protein
VVGTTPKSIPIATASQDRVLRKDGYTARIAPFAGWLVAAAMALAYASIWRT